MSEGLTQDVRVVVDNEFIDKLESRYKNLQRLITAFSSRNSFVESFDCGFGESRDLGDTVSVSPQLLEAHSEACRELRRLEQKHASLSRASSLLDERLAKADEVSREMIHARAIESMHLLSPTAAALMTRTSINEPSAVVPEVDVIRGQVSAIRDLCNGCVPKSREESESGIDDQINEEEDAARSACLENNRLLGELSVLLKRLYSDNCILNRSVESRRNVARSFSNFCDLYRSGKCDVNVSRLRRTTAALNRLGRNGLSGSSEELLVCLKREQCFLEEELALRGIGDAETESLKEEIDFNMLRLEHMTCVIGRCPSLACVGRPKSDPIENMLVDISNLEVDQ